MDRAELLQKIDATYEARARNDKEGVAEILAPGARYRLVGDTEMLSDFPTEAQEAQTAISTLIDRVKFENYERRGAVVEGNTAAIYWQVTLSVDGKPPVTTEFCDLWEFDEHGKASSLLQFIDTALLQNLLKA